MLTLWAIIAAIVLLYLVLKARAPSTSTNSFRYRLVNGPSSVPTLGRATLGNG